MTTAGAKERCSQAVRRPLLENTTFKDGASKPADTGYQAISFFKSVSTDLPSTSRPPPRVRPTCAPLPNGKVVTTVIQNIGSETSAKPEVVVVGFHVDQSILKSQNHSKQAKPHLPQESSLRVERAISLGGSPPERAKNESKLCGTENRSIKDEGIYMSNQAISESQHSSDWESLTTSSVKSSVDKGHTFERLNSRPNLATRRSSLSILIRQSEETSGIPSKSKSLPIPYRKPIPNGPCVAASPDDKLIVTIDPELPRSRPIEIAKPSIPLPELSPRSNNLKMLAVELGEPLRQQVLRESLENNRTANPIIKRRQDRANPGGHQNKPGTPSSSWSDEYSDFDHNLGLYPQKCW